MTKQYLVLVLVLTVIGCGPRDQYVCDEQHSAVANARALTKQQLSYVHSRVAELQLENPNTVSLYREGQSRIPDDLSFLGALQIDIFSHDFMRIKLADCLDEHVVLKFTSNDTGANQLELQWHTGPYSTESEILWVQEAERSSNE